MTLLAALASFITLAVSPNQCLEPCTMRAKIRLELPEVVKEVCLELVDGDFPTKSCWPPAARRTHEPQIANIPEGDYIVRAWAILAVTGERINANPQQLKVVGERGWIKEDGF